VQDYGVTISFYRAPYLVEIDVVQGKRILRLEEVDGNGDLWRNADVLSFNTGHWWEHQGSLQGYANISFLLQLNDVCTTSSDSLLDLLVLFSAEY